MITLPLCTNPVVIFNRGAINHIIRNGWYRLASALFDAKKVHVADENLFGTDYCSFELKEQYVRHFELSDSAKSLYTTDFPFKRFNRLVHQFYINGKDGQNSVYLNLLENCYTFNEYGHKVYLFMLVPCNHCQLCQDRRTSDFSSRVEMESSLSNTRPIMLTLTYNYYNLPFEEKVIDWYESQGILHEHTHYEKVGSLKSSPKHFTNDKENALSHYLYKGIRSQYPYYFNSPFEHRPTLNVPDVQKFLKRLRINWERRNTHPLYYADGQSCKSYEEYTGKFPFRYACIGEYGKSTSRPHYHLILWNLPYDLYNPILDVSPLAKLKSDIIDAWRMCSFHFDKSTQLYTSQSIQCEFARDCGKYVGKYIGKDLGGRKGTYQTSRREGGLGAKYIDTKLVPFFTQHPDQCEFDLLQHDGTTLRLSIGRYASHRIFQSLTSLIRNEDVHYLRKRNNTIANINSIYARYGHVYDTDDIITRTTRSKYLLNYLGIPCPRPNQRKVQQYAYYDDGRKIRGVKLATGIVDTTCFDLELMEDELSYAYIMELSLLDDFRALENQFGCYNDKEIERQLAMNDFHFKSLETKRSANSWEYIKLKEEKALERKKDQDAKLLF